MIDIENSEAWLLSKWGMFSASKLFHIMVPGTKGQLFSPGGITYIEEVANEAYTIFNMEENPMSYDMKMGKVREGASAAYYMKALGVKDMTYYGGGDPLFHHYCKDSGASPDVVLWKDEPNKIASFGGELKNPKSKTHMYYLRNFKNQACLKSLHLEYYTQCIFNMMTFKTDLWHWTSHNEYFPEKDRMLLLAIEPDKKFQNELDARLSAAIEKKYEIINELKNRE